MRELKRIWVSISLEPPKVRNKSLRSYYQNLIGYSVPYNEGQSEMVRKTTSDPLSR